MSDKERPENPEPVHDASVNQTRRALIKGLATGAAATGAAGLVAGEAKAREGDGPLGKSLRNPYGGIPAGGSPYPSILDLPSDEYAMQESFFLKRRFHDFDDLADKAREWHLDLRQLDGGRFRGDLLQFSSGTVLLTHSFFNRSLDQRGTPPTGLRTFGIPGDRSQRFNWNGQEISGDHVIVFPLGDRFECVSPPGFNVFHISAPDEYFVEIGRAVGISELQDLTGSSEVRIADRESIAKLRRSLRSFCKQILTSPLKLDDRELRHQLDVSIPCQLLRTMASSQPEFRKPSPRRREQALKDAQEYILEFSEESLTVRDLCRATRVSQRSLEYAFLEHFHVSPKAYMRNYRLNCVRKNLRSVDLRSTKIADVANIFGFWHLGQFAADYRNLFGELPSQTLARQQAPQT